MAASKRRAKSFAASIAGPDNLEKSIGTRMVLMLGFFIFLLSLRFQTISVRALLVSCGAETNCFMLRFVA